MGFSEFEFRQIGSVRYIEGYLVWRVQKQQARNTLFLTVGGHACEFGCSVKTYRTSTMIIVRRIIQIGYCNSV